MNRFYFGKKTAREGITFFIFFIAIFEKDLLLTTW
jgi:hypothetical protein